MRRALFYLLLVYGLFSFVATYGIISFYVEGAMVKVPGSPFYRIPISESGYEIVMGILNPFFFLWDLNLGSLGLGYLMYNFYPFLIIASAIMLRRRMRLREEAK